MAKRKTRASAKVKSLAGAIAFVLILFSIVLSRGNSSFENANATADANVSVKTSEYVSVHFIDVGQGSSTLIQCGNTGILIDTGEREYAETVVEYLKKVGIERLEYVVASHPHSDHIGGMVQIFENFHTENIIMPELSEINMPTTRIYEDLMNAVIQKNINPITAEYGKVYTVGGARLEILGPVEQVKDLNNMSVVCRVTAGSTRFLVLADAEKQEMQSIYELRPKLKCDVIALGHHGSRTSIQKAFLASAEPNVAIISCGKDNSYGHPHEETIDYLKKNKIEYYRTDYSGNIVFNCNDKGYAIECEVK